MDLHWKNACGRNRCADRLPIAIALILVGTVALPQQSHAVEIVIRHDNLSPGDPGFLVNPFRIGESVAAWLTAPVDGRIVAVQFVWRSGSGNAPPLQEDSITVFDAGTFPDPGIALAVIDDPILIDGEVNEFRHLDGAMTVPLDVPVSSGQTYVVAMKFANQPDVEPEGPGILADTGTCTSGGYTQFSNLTNQWVHLCPLGFPGNLAIRAVIEDGNSVPAASTWGLAAMTGIMLIAATILMRRRQLFGKAAGASLGLAGTSVRDRTQTVGLIAVFACGAPLTSNGQSVPPEMVYWTDGTTNSIHRATVNGEDAVTLISDGLDRPDGIAVDPLGKKMYWAEQGGRIQRANLDGSSLELIADVGGSPRDVALDLGNGKLYWIHTTAEGIQRANLDGSNVETFDVGILSTGSTIAIDETAGKVYWGASNIHRINLDGTDLELHFDVDNGARRRIELDVLNENMYWANAQFRFIAWLGFDGVAKGPNQSWATVGEPFDLAVDRANARMFWAENPFEGGSIMRSDLGGANATTIVSSGVIDPLGIALGPAPDAEGAVPTASAWGLVILFAIIVTAATILIRRRSGYIPTQEILA